VVRSTATLACIGRRQNYFRDEFLSTLEILERGDVPFEHLKGSWAGAFGPTQFMPTSFKRFAVDFDGDGKRNVVTSVPDVIASTANNLKKDGWHTGASWGYEVVLPQGFDFRLVDRSIRKSAHQWEALGVRRAGGKAFPRTGDVGSLLVPAGARGPAFLVVDNFRAIMKYNPSESYALAIGHLADRIRARRDSVVANGTARVAATACPARAIRWRRRRKPWRSNACGHPRLPGARWFGARWFCEQQGARTAAQRPLGREPVAAQAVRSRALNWPRNSAIA
jgi:hypothetical protein